MLAAAAVVSLVLLGYTAFNLRLNTSHTAMLSGDLPFWKRYEAFADVFPIVDEALFVVVDAETPLRVREATSALATRLQQRPEVFRSVYVPGGGPFFERNALLYLTVDEIEALTDRMAAIQPLLEELSRDRNLAGLARLMRQAVDMAQQGPDAVVDLTAVFDSVSQAAAAVLEGNPRPISWTEMLMRRSIPAESSRRLIVLDPALDYGSLLPARRAIATVRDAARELALTPEEGVTVRITGNPALNYEEMLVVSRDALLAALGSFVGVGGVLFLALRSGRLMAAVLVALLTGLIWTAAFAAFAVGHLNLASVSFAVLFIGLGVDFGIHLSMRYAELMRGGSAHLEALAESARGVGSSLVLCALTTMIGFYVFVPTDYRAIGELGLISGTGMPISLVCTLTLMPAMLSLRAPVASTAGRPAPRWFRTALIGLALRHARAVRLGALGLGLLSLLALPRLEFDHNVVRIRDPSTESVQTFQDLLSESHTSPWTIDAVAPDLDSADALARRLRQLDFVERAITLRDYVPSDQEEKLELLGDLALFVPTPVDFTTPQPSPGVAVQVAALKALRATLEAPWLTEGDAARSESARRALALMDRLVRRLEDIEGREAVVSGFERSLLDTLPAALDQLYGALEPGPVALEDLPADLVARMVASDGRARIQVLPSRDLSDNAELARFVDGVQAELPDATGSAVSLLEWARATARSFRQALVAAIAAVATVVWILWRRASDVLLVLAPLVLAALLTAATAFLVGIAFNFVNVIVIPLLLGIGVDSGIHLVHRHRLAGAGPLGEAGAEVLLSSSTAQAVFFSAITTMLSFGSLALSDHPGIRSMGQLLLIGIFLTLACNLVVLPALLARRS